MRALARLLDAACDFRRILVLVFWFGAGMEVVVPPEYVIDLQDAARRDRSARVVGFVLKWPHLVRQSKK
jgi:hypothetical protein